MIEPKFTKNEIDFLIDEFSIRTDSLKRRRFQGLNEGTRVYQIDGSKFIIDSLAGMQIGCYPHIVGDVLYYLALEAANDAIRVMKKLGYVNNPDDIIYERVLRACDGYELKGGFENFGMNFREVWLRPRYTTVSKGDHVHKELEILNPNFKNFPKERKKLTLIKPDTEAGGRTAELSLIETVKVAKSLESEIERVILYGYISEYSLDFIEKVAKSLGIKEVVAFCIGNVTALSANNYDMPLYGPDEYYWRENKAIRKLGAITSVETFKRYLPKFIPGADQPGDWSARQKRLFNGIGYEAGDIANHLSNSINYIKSLRGILPQISSIQDFLPKYDSMIERELSALERELQNLTVKM